MSSLAGGVLLLCSRVWVRRVNRTAMLTTVTAQSDPELFFGLRGGGPLFGIVVSMTVRTFPVPKMVSASFQRHVCSLHGMSAPAVRRPLSGHHLLHDCVHTVARTRHHALLYPTLRCYTKVKH